MPPTSFRALLAALLCAGLLPAASLTGLAPAGPVSLVPLTGSGLRFTTTADSAGVFRFDRIPPGVYLLEWPGHRQTVTVAEDERTLLPASLLTNTPAIPGRDVTQFAALAPGVTRVSAAAPIASGGQGEGANNVTADGADLNDSGVTIRHGRIVPEAVSELTVQTQAYSAEYGRNSGAQIEIRTQRGGSPWHGAAVEYYRASWFNPTPYADLELHRPRPRFSQHQANAGLGGPLRRERWFLYGFAEAGRLSEGASAANAVPVTVPTARGWQAIANVPLRPGQSEASRRAILAALEPARGLTEFTSLATIPINGVDVETGTTRIPIAAPASYRYAQARLDGVLSASQRLTLRAVHDRDHQPNRAGARTFGEPTASGSHAATDNLSALWTATPRPRVQLEARLTYYAQEASERPNQPESTPAITVPNYFSLGDGAASAHHRRGRLWQAQVSVSASQPRWSWKAGTELRHHALTIASAWDTAGSWSFPSLAALLNHTPSSARRTADTALADGANWNSFSYLQADLRLNPNTTLGLGLRYEVASVPSGLGLPPADTNNWGPRLSLAIRSPHRDITLRAGIGLAYDVLLQKLIPLNLATVESVPVIELAAAAGRDRYPDLGPADPNLPRSPKATSVATPANAAFPATAFYGLSVSVNPGRHTTVEVGYRGSHSAHQVRALQRNYGALTAEQAATVRRAGTPSAIPDLESRRLDPALGSRLSLETTGAANYNAAYARFEGRWGRRLTAGGAWTWSKTLSEDDAAFGTGSGSLAAVQGPQNPAAPRQDYGLSTLDRPHRLTFFYTASLPYGFELNGYTELQSGAPFTVRTGVDSLGTGAPTAARPDVAPSPSLAPEGAAAFTLPGVAATFLTPVGPDGLPLASSMAAGGNLGRNTFRAAALATWNFSLARRLWQGERFSAQLRADVTNSFNHRNFGAPAAALSNPSAFGHYYSDPGSRIAVVRLQVRY